MVSLFPRSLRLEVESDEIVDVKVEHLLLFGTVSKISVPLKQNNTETLNGLFSSSIAGRSLSFGIRLC